MPAPLISRVFSLVHQHEGQMGERPKVLYVGQQEWDEMKGTISTDEVVEDASVPDRFHFHGFPVYLVDATSYLACG